MFINYAHRGASEYAPENTLPAFYKGVEQGANGIETDIQKTKDGVLVLFHDKEISRVTNGEGKISEYNYEELLKLDAGSYLSEVFVNEKIVSFEDFLKYFSSKPLHFAIELKDSYIEAEVLQLIDKYAIKDRVTITAFEFDNLVRIRQLDQNIKIGWLTSEITEEAMRKLKDINAREICPSVKSLSKDKVDMAKAEGFSVRAWGVKDESLMHYAISCGVDGMTVNFPDKLTEAVKSQRGQ